MRSAHERGQLREKRRRLFSSTSLCNSEQWTRFFHFSISRSAFWGWVRGIFNLQHESRGELVLLHSLQLSHGRSRSLLFSQSQRERARADNILLMAQRNAARERGQTWHAILALTQRRNNFERTTRKAREGARSKRGLEHLGVHLVARACATRHRLQHNLLRQTICLTTARALVKHH